MRPNRSLGKIVADNIKRYRVDSDLSQLELAERVGLHATTIGLIERCERSPSIVTLEKIAKGLGVEVWRLMKEGKYGNHMCTLSARQGL